MKQQKNTEIVLQAIQKIKDQQINIRDVQRDYGVGQSQQNTLMESFRNIYVNLYELIELKKCPCCGHNAMFNVSGDCNYVSIECVRCSIHTGDGFLVGKDEEEMISEWNTRVEEKKK